MAVEGGGLEQDRYPGVLCDWLGVAWIASSGHDRGVEKLLVGEEVSPDSCEMARTLPPLKVLASLISTQAGREWSEYYKDEGIQRQKAFWDRFLKGIPNEVDSWSPVESHTRVTSDQSLCRREKHFPPASSRMSSLYLQEDGQLVKAFMQKKATFSSYMSHKTDSCVQFSHTFAYRTEITGFTSVKLYVQAIGYPDTDLYISMGKIGTDGKEIFFWNKTQKLDAPAGLGWLRASHREVDERRSLPGRPYHKHQRRQWLQPWDIVEVEVEIWPSSTVWEAGEKIRLTVQGTPFDDQDHPTQFRANRHNFGEVRIWHGGEYPSVLFVPVCESKWF